MPAREREREETGRAEAAAVPACVSAWLVPGLGHVLLGRHVRGLIFFAVVILMFTMGLYLQGELFPLDRSQPLTMLKGLAELGVGLPYFAAKLLSAGAGDVTAVTYEYGWTFMVVAGLLNMLIILDAFDIAVGRKD